jgi:SET and MYND domain-containing protein
LVYPGIHLLELAKTTWNATITTHGLTGDEIQTLKQQLPVFLSLAHQILMVLGPEGDDVGPLQEIRILQQLLPDI